jgi:1-phosphatidylinositol-4-phosphate 5-kinase
MTMVDEEISETTRAMADVPPPPPPMKSPSSLKPSPVLRPVGGSDDLTVETLSLGSSAAVQHFPTSDGIIGNNTNATASTTPSNSSSTLLSTPLLLEIEEGTPAAEALKANADVRVSKLRKVGRSTRLQAGVRALKSGWHTGDRRGAPAFVAPRNGREDNGKGVQTSMIGETIPEADEDEERGEGDVSSEDYDDDHDESMSGDKDYHSDDNHHHQDVASLNVHDLHESTGSPLRTSLGQKHSSVKFVTHAPASAVAAACFAGEELDRARNSEMEAILDSVPAPMPSKSPMKSAFTGLFKSSASPSSMIVEDVARNEAATVNGKNRWRDGHRRSSSISEGIGMHRRENLTLHRRASSASLQGSPSDDMPSEISVDTEKQGNLRLEDEHDLHPVQQISFDAEDYPATMETLDNEDPTKSCQKQEQLEINPIIVNIPGSKRLTIEEKKEEENIHEEKTADCHVDGASMLEETDDRQEAMKKSKLNKSKLFSTRKLIIESDDDGFNFIGPRSVRKWVQRRRSQDIGKSPRSYVKGKVIDGTHELYTMSIAVMFGMRTSIGRTNQAMSETAKNESKWLDNEDLMAVVKYEFPPKGSKITPPHLLNHTFKFKDYSPLAFAYLRRMFGVNEYDFLLSVCGNANYIEFQSNAKSGQFFFYSPDGKYMIKTMTNTESKFLRRIMPHYFRHCAMNPNTLMTKFLGMYRVKLYHLKRNVKFVVMKSVYDTDKHLHQLFDVKGSMTGRDAKPGDAVKKDNDIRRTLPEGAFILEPGLRERLKTQVEHDCQWLKSMKIMDYSMLIGVHNISHRNTKTLLRPVMQRARSAQKDDIDDHSNSSIDVSSASLDRFLDVDDDDSYLDGDNNNKGTIARVEYDSSTVTSDEAVRTVRIVRKPSVDEHDESSKESRKEMDASVEKAICDMYWPFHRFYDIQGLRRMKPMSSETVANTASNQSDLMNDDRKSILNTLFSHDFAAMTDGGRCDLPQFERPLSNRKDGGFMMDTTTCDLPLKMSLPGAPHLVDYCDGKIFYMGIIDILQQFNIRKRGEARYRRLGGKGWEAASCVHPNIYADRFIRFFEEYTGCPQPLSECEKNKAD